MAIDRKCQKKVRSLPHLGSSSKPTSYQSDKHPSGSFRTCGLNFQKNHHDCGVFGSLKNNPIHLLRITSEMLHEHVTVTFCCCYVQLFFKGNNHHSRLHLCAILWFNALTTIGATRGTRRQSGLKASRADFFE